MWRISLLRADRVIGGPSTEMPGLIAVSLDDQTTYIDTRLMTHRPEGYGSAFLEATPQEAALSPYFHPYKVYVLHHVARTLRIQTSNCQYLRWTPGIQGIVDSEVQHLSNWTASVSFADRFNYWNLVSKIGIAQYPKGLVISDATLSTINIERDAFHGDWNYCIRPG